MLHIRCTALTWVLAAVFIIFAVTGSVCAQYDPAPSYDPTAAPAADTIETDVAFDDATDETTDGMEEVEDTAEEAVITGPGGQVSIVTKPEGTNIRAILNTLSQYGREQGKKSIVPSQAVEGKMDLRLTDVEWEVALEAVLRTNNLVAIEEENLIYVYTEEEAKKFRPIKSRIFKLQYLRASDAKDLVTKSLSPVGSITTTPVSGQGIAPSQEEAGGQGHASGEVLIVYDYEENLEKIEQLLDELDIQPDQVLIEATILSATLTEENALGVNIDAITGAEFGQFVDADGVATTTALQNGLNVPATDINNLNRRQARFSVPMSANQALEGSPLTVGLVWNDISVFVRALEQITDTTVLANPKLLVVNSMRGEVLIGRKEGYLTTTITTTAAAQTVEYLETGTRLIVRPWVMGDGNVRMEIHPEVSEGGVEAVGEQGTALPSAATTETTTNVMVRDGKTLVIAGLFRERDVANRAQVPVIGSIPILGLPFRSTADTKLREEVIILITPHIIRTPADEAVSEQLRNDMERTRIGARRGMMWLNRGQFADWHYQKAVRDLAAGKRSDALWNLDLALAYEPKMMQAIKKKEELTNEAYWADQPRFVMSRNVIQRMIMQDLGEPIEPVIYPTRPLDARQIPSRPREAMGIDNPPSRGIVQPGPARFNEPVIEPVPSIGPEPEIIAPPADDSSYYNATDESRMDDAEESTLSEEMIIEAEPVEAPTPPGHTPDSAPETDSFDEGASQAPSATPTIDRLLEMDADEAGEESTKAGSSTVEPKAAPAVPAEPRKVQPRPQGNPKAQPQLEVTQRTTARSAAQTQSVRPLRVWVPKSTSPQKPDPNREVPSLWEAMNEEETN